MTSTKYASREETAEGKWYIESEARVYNAGNCIGQVGFRKDYATNTKTFATLDVKKTKPLKAPDN